jgi:hypothetical protein
MTKSSPEKLEYMRKYRRDNSEQIKANRLLYKPQQTERDRIKHDANPSKRLDRQYEKRYGLTLAEVLAMFDEAHNACQCCGSVVARPATRSKRGTSGHLDHCHTTGKIRGILCGSCNRALGLLNDKPEMAVAYLAKTA